MKEKKTDQNIKLLCIFLYGSVVMNWRYVYVVVLLYVIKTWYAMLDISVAYIDSDIFNPYPANVESMVSS